MGIGTILAVFRSEGKVPLKMDMLNKVASEGAMLAAVDFSIFAEIPSQPVALVTSMLVNSSVTDSSVQSSSLGQSAGSKSKVASQLVNGLKEWLKNSCKKVFQSSSFV